MALEDDMLGRIRKILDLPWIILRVLCDLVEKLNGDEKDQWFFELKCFLRRQRIEVFFEPYRPGCVIAIEATDGTETLLGARDVFSGIDDMHNLVVDEPSGPRGVTSVEMHRLLQNHISLSRMFSLFQTDASNLCFSEHQIKFFMKRCAWLYPENGLFLFLFESKGEFVIAAVNSRKTISFFSLAYSSKWPALSNIIIVTPKLD